MGVNCGLFFFVGVGVGHIHIFCVDFVDFVDLWVPKKKRIIGVICDIRTFTDMSRNTYHK